MALHLIVAIAILGGVLDAPAPEAVEEKLAAPILRAEQTRTELEAAVLSRLPALRVPDSAEDWSDTSRRLRGDVLHGAVLRGVPAAWTEGPVKVEWLETIEHFDGYVIR